MKLGAMGQQSYIILWRFGGLRETYQIMITNATN